MSKRHSHCIWLCTAAILLTNTFVLFATPGPLSSDDGLRHIRIAEHYREKGVNGVGGWGNYFFTGYFREKNFDPWFLADLAYVPFSLFPDQVIGLKVATLTFIALLLTTFLLFLRYYRASTLTSFLFLLLFFTGSMGFSSRLLLGRPFVLSTVLFLLTYYVILRKKYVLLVPLLLISTLLSHLFIFSLFLCISASLWLFILKRFREGAFMAISASFGVLIGLLSHPQTSLYVRYLWQVFLPIGFSQEVGTGSELRTGLNGGDIGLFIVFFLILSFSFGVLTRTARRTFLTDRPAIFLSVFLSTLFFLMYLLWVRSIDFLWPLVCVLLLQLVTLSKGVEEETLRILRLPLRHGLQASWLHLFVLVCVVGALGVFIPRLLHGEESALQRFNAIEAVPKGARVLNIDWDIFPSLFFLNDEALYARGMDPTFDYRHNTESFELLDANYDRWNLKQSLREGGIRSAWQEFRGRMDFAQFVFTRFREREDLDERAWVEQLRSYFGADYLVLRNDFHPKLIERLRKLPDLPFFSESAAITVFAF